MSFSPIQFQSNSLLLYWLGHKLTILYVARVIRQSSFGIFGNVARLTIAFKKKNKTALAILLAKKTYSGRKLKIALS